MTDMNEIWAKMNAKDAELAKQIFVSNGYITINVKYEYNIELSRCNTHAKILAWVVHLAEKTWMTVELNERFILLAMAEANLELPHA